jgi:hypothetical protein
MDKIGRRDFIAFIAGAGAGIGGMIAFPHALGLFSSKQPYVTIDYKIKLSNGIEVLREKIVEQEALRGPRKGAAYVISMGGYVVPLILVDEQDGRPYVVPQKYGLKLPGTDSRIPWEDVLHTRVPVDERNYKLDYEYDGRKLLLWESPNEKAGQK